MPLLLTLLSVLAAWALLGVLVFGLLFVLKALQGVRRHLEKITMGVRAIEHQARPLGDRVQAAAGSLARAGDAIARLASRLREADRLLGDAAPAIRRILGGG